MIKSRKSAKYPHVEWLDLENTGVYTECAIVKRDSYDNIYFIRLANLDSVDKRRIFQIIKNRNAPNFELWDLMANVSLGNGINALVYFHQLVEVVTRNGHISKPQIGRKGLDMSVPVQQPAPAAE